MSETNRNGIYMLIGAALLGLLGDGLMRMAPPGLGLALWIAAVLASLSVLVRLRRVAPAPEAQWLSLLALTLGAAFAWRASPALTLLNVAGLGVLMALTAAHARGGVSFTAGVMDYTARTVVSGLHAAAGFLPIAVRDIRWDQLPRGPWSSRLAAVLRGLLVAVPLLLLFGLLFMSADAVFATLVQQTLDVNLEALFADMLLASAFAWLAGGFLRGAMVAERPEVAWQLPAPVGIGTVESTVVMGLLNALFLAFVLVQFRYFFGGAALVENTVGMTYAEYGRHGFFELVGVTGLSLPVLLIGDWLVAPAGKRRFRLLAILQIGLLGVIMASAFRRMLLYINMYGLTELRLYVTAFMIWMALVLVWFLLTALRGRRERFAIGVLATGAAMLLGLHLINPDALITRFNIDRMAAGSEVDAQYLLALGPDAVPLLVARLPELPAADRPVLAQALLERWADRGGPGWRGWNWGRHQAALAVRGSLKELRVLAAEGANWPRPVGVALLLRSTGGDGEGPAVPS